MIAPLDLNTFRAASGYRPTYRQGEHCPGCGRASWYVGRTSAECASCGTAIPLASRSPEAAHG